MREQSIVTHSLSVNRKQKTVFWFHTINTGIHPNKIHYFRYKNTYMNVSEGYTFCRNNKKKRIFDLKKIFLFSDFICDKSKMPVNERRISGKI